MGAAVCDRETADFALSELALENWMYAAHTAMRRSSTIIHGIIFLHEKQESVPHDPVEQDLSIL